MKYSILTILFLILTYSCNSNQSNQQNIKNQKNELNCISNLKYIERNGRVDSTMIDYIKADWTKEYKIEFKNLNDTLFLYGSKLNENVKNYRLYPGPYLTSKTKYNSELNCSEKLIIHQKEIKYSFCYKEVIDFLDKQIKKGKEDPYFTRYKKEKRDLINQFSNNEAIYYCDYILYDFLFNLPFFALDKYNRTEVDKIILSNYYTGWSGGSEYFLLDNKNDTIAYNIIGRWVN